MDGSFRLKVKQERVSCFSGTCSIECKFQLFPVRTMFRQSQHAAVSKGRKSRNDRRRLLIREDLCTGDGTSGIKRNICGIGTAVLEKKRKAVLSAAAFHIMQRCTLAGQLWFWK